MEFKDPLYGKQQIKDKLAIDIINAPEIQRLKGVNQYGVWKYLLPHMTASRFEHSIGVFLFLNRMGADREEQIAGLVHDIGHTAFSHVFDYAFGRPEVQDYNDVMQEKILNSSVIPALLEKEGMNPESILDHNKFSLLETEIPEICADRIDSLLRDSLYYRLTPSEEIAYFLDSISSKDKMLFVSSPQAANILALRFMAMNQRFWCSLKQNAIYCLAGQAIKTAIEKKVITEKDFFGTDDALFCKLKESGISEIISRLDLLKPTLRVVDNPNDFDFFSRGKCRYIDPKVLYNGRFLSLSEVDSGFKEKIKEFKKTHSKGHHIKIIGV